MNFLKSFCLTIVLALTSLSLSAQPIDPVAWKTSVKQDAEGVYAITFSASVDKGWHIYDLGPYEGGPMATTFTFEGEGFELQGAVEASVESVKQHNDIFDMEIGHYEGSVDFVQKVKAQSGTVINVMAEWMVCNDENCVTGERDFKIKLGEGAAPAVKAEVKSASEADGGSIWGYILSAVGWALVALLTPCVFPMIPMTVSFFLKGSGSVARGRFRALMYGLFIVLLYTLPIGVIIFLTWLIGGDAVTADIFNWI
ncbi:MAG: thiol:disulfide interchange protein, partial [Alistipes sp.]|nr:thiol:disulfide interchange protein [Alistipes sp.]